MTVLRSRDNARVKRWTKLVRDARLRRAERRVMVEGPNLVEAALRSRASVQDVLVAESAVETHQRLLESAGTAPVVVSDAVFRSIVDSETPQGVALELELSSAAGVVEGNAVFLEAVQDPGNVGAILRSAAAFGIRSAVLDAGCAEPWSAKVLRAGAGAHFALAVRQVDSLDEALAGFKGKLVCTLAHGGSPLRKADLSGTLGWIFGSEGQGVSPALLQRAQLRITIAIAPGTESLNVAAAAAVCFYQASSRPGAGS
jgi:RNA methyltransferase, TrmH family